MSTLFTLFTTFLRFVWAYACVGYALACEGVTCATSWLGQQCSDASVWLEAKLHELNTPKP